MPLIGQITAPSIHQFEALLKSREFLNAIWQTSRFWSHESCLNSVMYQCAIVNVTLKSGSSHDQLSIWFCSRF